MYVLVVSRNRVPASEVSATFVGSNVVSFCSYPKEFSTSIPVITTEPSFFPASFTSTATIGSYLRLTPKKKESDTGLPSSALRTKWFSVHLYPEGIFILKVFTFRKQLRVLGKRAEQLYPLSFLTTAIIFSIQQRQKISLFCRSKVTRLKVIHISYTYHSFLFLSPQKTSSFSFDLAVATYPTPCEESIVVLGASHPTIASGACPSRKPVVVHRVKSILNNSCKLLIFSSLTVFIATSCRTILYFVVRKFYFSIFTIFSSNFSPFHFKNILLIISRFSKCLSIQV